MAWIGYFENSPRRILEDGIRGRKAGEPRMERLPGMEAADVALWNFGWDLADGYDAAVARLDGTDKAMRDANPFRSEDHCRSVV